MTEGVVLAKREGRQDCLRWHQTTAWRGGKVQTLLAFKQLRLCPRPIGFSIRHGEACDAHSMQVWRREDFDTYKYQTNPERFPLK